MEIEGFICIQGFFALINSRAGRLKILGADQKAKSTAKDIPYTSAVPDYPAGPTTPVKSALKNGSGKITAISSTSGPVAQNLDFTTPTKTVQIDTTGTGMQT